MSVILRGNQLCKLLARLKELPRSTLVAGELQSTIDNKFNHYEFIVDTWPEFKVVLLRPHRTNHRMKYIHNVIQLYSLEPENLKDLLRKKDIIDWSKNVRFAEMDCRLQPAVCDVAKEHHQPMMRKRQAYVFRVNQRMLKVKCVPQGSFLSSLQPDQCDLVNAHWPYRGEGSTNYIRFLIETLPSCCLYNKDRDMLGYALSYHHGCLAMLHVMEDHRSEGYAKVIISHLANTWLQTCEYVYAAVDTTNTASIKVLKILGWEVMEDLQIIWLNTV